MNKSCIISKFRFMFNLKTHLSFFLQGIKQTKNYSFFITAENIDGIERVQAADLLVE